MSEEYEIGADTAENNKITKEAAAQAAVQALQLQQQQQQQQHYDTNQHAIHLNNVLAAQQHHPNMHPMPDYGMYGWTAPPHSGNPYAMYAHPPPHGRQSDPRYMNPMTGPPGVAMEAHGFPMSSQNPLGFPNYLPSDYNQSSHRPHPSQHHAASTGHPYAADTSMGGGPSSSRRKARQQQQEQPQQQPQQQSPSLHQQPMHPQQQFHPMDHNAMQYPNYAVPPHPHDPIYTHHVATGIPYDPSGNFGHPNGSFSDPNLTSSGAHVEFDPMTGAPLPPRLPNSGANASSNGDPGVDSNRAQSSSKGAVPAGKEGRSAAASALVSTIVAVTNEKGNKVYKCPRPLCTKTYKNPNGLKYHLDRGACEVDHDVMEATTGISLHTDDPTALFNLQQQAQQALNGGYEAFAGGQKGSGSTGSADQRGLTAALIASDESLKIVHRPYGCKIVGCGKRYQNLNGLKYHAKTAHPGLDFKADIYVLFPF